MTIDFRREGRRVLIGAIAVALLVVVFEFGMLYEKHLLEPLMLSILENGRGIWLK